MNNRTLLQTLLLLVGGVVLLGGLVCVVSGFAGFASSDPGSDGDSSMMLFAAGGFAAVIGFGLIAFTRAAILTRNGAYARVTIEQATAPRGGRFCSSCGTATSPTARFCESCGAAVG
ncbi:zinc-ribbon domain-containing protein [Nocardioides sp. YIM 152315]|uniref:zinc-ribbon domain-containing protein n=1 Tax=Nocardioides sp. YIM 152315 TaxID=3031760 RepID=UPI0023DC5978|nr:zinc-ribbon domain-containing protein [Nocardioides sp. YIM 152315]MDF1605998.1 zinc-ribbon domain-containing protein [Nocardioides sp. YIM 152315]